MFVSSVVLWCGCLLVYLCSPNQKIIKNSLQRKHAYPLALCAVVVSWLGFIQQYSGIIAALMVLTLMMVMWNVMVLLLGHIKTNLLSFIIGGSVVSAFITLLGSAT